MASEQDNNKSPFELNNFKTGDVVLPGLGFIAHFRPGMHYLRYDGPVHSLNEYVASLPNGLDEPLKDYDFRGKGGFNCGLILDSNILDPPTGYLMAVLNITPKINVSNEGHEVAEIMKGLGMDAQLEAGLSKLGFPISLEKLGIHQVGAVGGFVAAKIHGFDVVDLYRDYDPEALVTFQELGLI